MGKYKIQCIECKKTYDTDGYRLVCDNEKNGQHRPSLLKSIYEKKQIEPKNLPGIFKYIDWLPCGNKYLDIEGLPVAYKSHGLAEHLELDNLYIVFSGYWPAKGSMLVTRTFKELEAPATIIRYLTEKENPMPLIVSSAGNTANAFNYITNKLDLPFYMVVPEHGLRKLRLPIETNPHSIAVRGTYSDAIEMADEIAKETGLFREGGVKNIARRDGMAIAMIEAVVKSGNLFDHYFQAIGSGSGGIAAWEAVQRLRKDGRFGDTNTKLHLSQNAPFSPLVDSWKVNSVNLRLPIEANEKIDNVIAKVLTNQHPPYEIRGGVRDALLDTDGEMYAIKNDSLFDAARIFRAKEGIDIGPAAAVATASLIKAIEEGKIEKDEQILLHITGGGFEAELERFGKNLYEFTPELIVNPGETAKIIKELGEIKPLNVDESIIKCYND